MNGATLLLFAALFVVGWWLHRRQLAARDREFQEFVAEVRLAEMVRALNDTGDEVAHNVFATKGRWN